jgi:hypothetical protein
LPNANLVATAAGCDKVRRGFGASEIATAVPADRSLRQRLQRYGRYAFIILGTRPFSIKNRRPSLPDAIPVAAAAGCDKSRRGFGANEIAAAVPADRSLRQRLQGLCLFGAFITLINLAVQGLFTRLDSVHSL